MSDSTLKSKETKFLSSIACEDNPTIEETQFPEGDFPNYGEENSEQYVDRGSLYQARINARKEIGVFEISFQDYDYDFNKLLKICMPVLSKHGLLIRQDEVYVPKVNGFALRTVLQHLPSEKSIVSQKRLFFEDAEEHKKAYSVAQLFGILDILTLFYESSIPEVKVLQDMESHQAITVSVSDVNLFFECRRCFVLKVKFKISTSFDKEKVAVGDANDMALKQRFSLVRSYKKRDSLIKKLKLMAIPFPSSLVKIWQNYEKGLAYHDRQNGIRLTGAIDEVLLTTTGELVVLEFKVANNQIDLSKHWGVKYARQISLYAYLLKNMGYAVYKKGFILACKPKIYEADDAISFLLDEDIEEMISSQHHLDFDIDAVSILIDDSWIDETLEEIGNLLQQKTLPEPGRSMFNPKYLCANCEFALKVSVLEQRERSISREE